MAKLKNSAQRMALAGSFALAVAAAPLMAALAVPAAGPAVAECPAGQTANPATGACEALPEGTPPGEVSFSTPGDANSLPEVQGIPCTGANTGQCIGLQEEQQAPVVEPHSTISSSP
ncbi:intersectin-EH binding protein Ibp1 [Mycolicibacterium sp. CH28]|uniref:intersectin-EH binding protein Ibp1 n=1 Tax=Mycolicibacterium sp. CH28 TaxID=2512237 RepID=UPI001081AA8A|nr:intersectin-EH binding protein Ibp1 [Mycolicibacterium sp. CH28]TGD84091.1 intersectin-EH binding protein Ibp1 [Mycolicibacterium sp. CH28]